MTKHKTILFYTLAAIIIAATIYPQSPKRSDVPDKYKWNLADMYQLWLIGRVILKKLRAA
jgi:hypothetical protein